MLTLGERDMMKFLPITTRKNANADISLFDDNEAPEVPDFAIFLPPALGENGRQRLARQRNLRRFPYPPPLAYSVFSLFVL